MISPLLISFPLFVATFLLILVLHACLAYLYLSTNKVSQYEKEGSNIPDPATPSSLLPDSDPSPTQQRTDSWQKEWMDQIATLDLTAEQKKILVLKLMNSQRFSNKTD